MRFGILAVISTVLVVFLDEPLPAGQFPADPGVFDTSEPLSFFIEGGSEVNGHDPADDELARLAFAAWSRESGGRLEFRETDSPDDARVRLIWVGADSGLFGQARRTFLNGKAGAVVFVTPEVSALGPDLAARVAEDPLLRHAIVYLTCVHELGHAVGLPHTRAFDDIMYSFGFGGDIVEYFMRYRRNLRSIDDISDHSGLSDGDRRVLGRLYGFALGTGSGEPASLSR